MIPTFALPGERMPGQFGPTSRERLFFLIVLYTRSFVSLSTSMRTGSPPRGIRPRDLRWLGSIRPPLIAGKLDDARGGAIHRGFRVHSLQVGLGQQLAALLVVRSVEAHDERHLR